MFPLSLREIWLTILFWNNVCSQLLYENNNEWDHGLIRDSKEASTQLLQERLEALLKETKLESELWRGRYETLTDFHNKLPTICKEHVHNVSKVNDICRDDPSLVFPHHDECQLYYNCSLTYTDVPPLLEQHMVECPYPSLFSTKSLRCENFTEVCCGMRKEVKDKCEYRFHADIYTCKSDNPSCSGKIDGFHKGNVGIHSYFSCFKERLMTTGTCDENSLWNIKKIIHKGQCRNPYEVSDKDGGLLPSCEGKEDGNYSNDFGGYYIHFGQYTKDYFGVGRKCDAYYQCKGGVATAVKCPNGTTFESLSRSCKPGNHSIGLGCQLYCNPNFDRYGFPNNLAECPYPAQFSDVTNRCENFTKVNCGSRPQVKDYCSYWITRYANRNLDGIIYCVKHHLNCTGLPDGVYEHPTKRPGPDYVKCLQEREIGEGTCMKDYTWHEQMYPFDGRCTQRYAIPTSYYGIGRLPDCSRKEDGHYEYLSRPCDAYYKCKGGVASAVKCPPITSFNRDTGLCMTGNYFQELCRCRHCDYLKPSCKEKGNGIWQHPFRTFSPWYILCKDNRTIEEGFCPYNKVWRATQFPYNGQCVHLYAIPKEYSSLAFLPSCNGKLDGNYQYPERPCDAYYNCKDEKATAVKCPGNTVYDSSNQTCVIGGICNE